MIVKTIHDECTAELLDIMRLYEYRAQAHPSEDMLSLKIELNQALMIALRKHQRTLYFKAGKTIEPETHTAEVVLTPKGGMAG